MVKWIAALLMIWTVPAPLCAQTPRQPARVNTGVLVVAASASFTNQAAFKYAPPGSAERFIRNLGKYFAPPGKPGKFLVYSTTGAFGVSFERALTQAGHTVVRTVKPSSLASFDGIFTAGDDDNINRDALTKYVRDGGKVYLVASSGEGEDEISFWNGFLSPFGMELTKLDPFDPFLVRSLGDSPLFDGVGALYVKSACDVSPTRVPAGGAPRPRILAHEDFLNVMAMFSTREPAAGAQSTPAADPIQNPENGHYYQAVSVEGGLKWSDANDAARKLTYKGMTGHLVTITSESETRFLAENFPNALRGTYWIGALKDLNDPDFKKPAAGWKWVTGEPWKYTNWADREPNGDYGAQNSDHIQLWGNFQWNDAPNDQRAAPAKGYIVEFEKR